MRLTYAKFCLIATTEVGAQFGDVRPLDEARRRTLRVNRLQLLDRMESDIVFITELARLQCITEPQREHLKHITQPRDRNQKLIEFLMRRSVADLKNFTKVLAKEQAFLVPLITDGGEIVCLLIVCELSVHLCHVDDCMTVHHSCVD